MVGRNLSLYDSYNTGSHRRSCRYELKRCEREFYFHFSLKKRNAYKKRIVLKKKRDALGKLRTHLKKTRPPVSVSGGGEEKGAPNYGN